MFVNVSCSPGTRAGGRIALVPDPEELVQVYATGSLSDGLLIKGRLEAEGIPVLLKGEGEGPYRVGPVYLWVPNGLEVQARLVLESLG
jgi:Putative prokaryotic signal transducing protein